tara:strand:+ start:62 stop:517 length:456 start_codon:yes stop_codon:yes gene_type:complete
MKQIDFIRNGTVIDHIKAGEAFKVLEVLQMIEHISEGQCKVMIGCNFDSGEIGRKDIIKISGGFLTQKEVNQVSLIAPRATVSIIRESRIIDKYSLQVETELHNIIACRNPNCITNVESMPTRFHTLSADAGEFQCHYCEVIMEKEDLRFV